MINKCIRRFKNISEFGYILFSVSISVVIAFISVYLESIFYMTSEDTPFTNPIILIVVGPFVETILLVCGVTLVEKLVKKEILVILIVDFLFVQMHTVGFISKVSIFCMGFWGLYGYMIYKGRLSPFIRMYIIHVAYNGILLGLSYL